MSRELLAVAGRKLDADANRSPEERWAIVFTRAAAPCFGFSAGPVAALP